MARQTKDEKQKNEIGFLSRWSARKEQVSKGEIVPDDEPKVHLRIPMNLNHVKERI